MLVRLGILIITLLATPRAARAASEACEFYRKFIPMLANSACGGARSAKPAGANSTFSGGFNVNPGSAPVEPSPYGLETISSYIRKDRTEWHPDFSIIKGFKKFGGGVSTSAASTFYSNDVVRRRSRGGNIGTFAPLEPERGRYPNLNVGTAFALNPSQKGRLSALKLGLSLRYNKTTDKIGGGFGLIGGNGFLTYGAGISRERVSNLLPAVYFGSAMLGVQLILVELEYTVLKNYQGDTLPPVQIGTATFNLGRVLITTAMRRVSYLEEGTIYQSHYGIQVNLSKRISLGYLFNYIPGANSLAAQIFL